MISDHNVPAIAVMFNDVKIAIQSSVENGSKNARSGISDFVFGAARSDTPL